MTSASVSHRRLASDRGSATLELALLGPALLLLTLLIVQTAMWFHARQVAQAAAEQGARAARAYQGTEADGRQATNASFTRLKGSRVTEGSVTVVSRRDNAAGTVTVTLQTKAVRVTPFLPAWRVNVVAGGPIEQFQPAGGP